MEKYIWLFIALLTVVLLGCILFLVLIHEGYLNKLLAKLGLKSECAKRNWTAFSWTSCLQNLGYTADIVFFGDSITRGGPFNEAFKTVKVVNLGCTGNNISELIDRIPMAATVAPKKIFLQGGINSLTDFNLSKCVEKYELLINKIQEVLPETEIYIQSVLPITREKEKRICHNKTIVRFNSHLKLLATKYKLTYIELYRRYELNGAMNPKYTVEGLHLKPDAYHLWIEAIREFVE